MAEQIEFSSVPKITPQDIKKLAHGLADFFEKDKNSTVDQKKYEERFENWNDHLKTLDEMEKTNYLTREQKNYIIANLICKKEFDSEHDFLTGLYNRNGFEKIVEIFINKSCHDGTSVTVAIFDVDNFKALNDEKGYNEGDNFLKKLASILEGTKRKEDVVCRWGGDEFLLLFNLNEEQSKKVTARIEKTVSRFIQLTYAKAGLSKPLGFSFGMVAWNGREKFEDFLNRADKKLREMKEEKKEANG